jgi:predicted RNA-binding protein YlqC (UPF0109 family)
LALFGGRLCPVPDVDEHVLLYHLMMHHQLGEFLNEMLRFQGSPSKDELIRRHPLPHVQALRTALARSEQDRADRLDVINRLDAEVQMLRTTLATSEQDRADRLDVINRLGAKVQALRTALATSKQAKSKWENTHGGSGRRG